jgi:GxxExxY protein
MRIACTMNRGMPGDRRPAIEMTLHGLTFQRQVELSLTYDGVRLPRAYRADIVVGETVILEIKSVEHILPANISCRFTRHSA